jgi:hypothetical protein
MSEALRDARKALRYWDKRKKDGSWDRFDDLALPSFWVALCRLLAAELAKHEKDQSRG